jgi:uncharacterized SAM-binding protein YcdF (DUF218 family)
MTMSTIPAIRTGRRIFIALLALALCAHIVFFAGFLFFVGSLDTKRSGPLVKSDAAAVLTGGTLRIREALHFLAFGKTGRLLISGVNPATSAQTLRRLIPSHSPLFTCCIDLGHEAADTSGNAREIAAWVRRHNIRSLTVITSSYHMPRALLELRAVLPDIRLIPYPVFSATVPLDKWWRHYKTTRLLFREYVKYLAARIKTGLSSQAG